MTTTAEAAAQPIRVFQDILDILAGHPQVADMMRQHLLTQELLNLPQVVAQIAADQQHTNEVVAQLAAELQRTNEAVERTNEAVERTNEVLAQVLEVQSQHTQDIAELKAGQAGLEAGQAKLEAGQAGLEAGQAKLEAGQAKLEAGQAKLEAGQAKLEAGQAKLEDGQAKLEDGQAKMEIRFARLETGQENLSAKFLPLDAKKMVGTIAGIFNIRRPVWLDNTDLLNIVDEAGDAADDVPENELQSLIRSDLALRAIGKSDRQTRYVLIECSGSITRNDVSRARRNADHLAHITTSETYALVIGRLPPENILREAEANGVRCLQPSEKVTRVA